MPAPEWLSAEASLVWAKLPAGVVDTADPDQLGAYCSAVADYQRAQGQLDRSGQLIRGDHGGLVRNPLAIVVRQNVETMRRLGRELGITTAAPPGTRRSWRNQSATERTITALRQGGRLEGVDEAALALARHLARALDTLDAAQYPAQTASLARVQLNVIRSLRGIDTERDEGPGVAELLALLSSPVGDESQP